MKPIINKFIFLFIVWLGFTQPIRAVDILKDDSLQIIMLDLESGDEALQQCSRKHLFGYAFWQPTFDQIWIIEDQLKEFLKQQTFKNKDFKPLPLSNWNRQVIGYEDEGVQYVFFNYYPKRDIPLRDDKFIPINMCGGGEKYWGVVFNLESMKFENFEVNPIGRPAPLFIKEEPKINF